MRFVAQTAREAGLDDYRVLVNVGAGAGQTVFHLHWHVLGGRPDAARIAAALEKDTMSLIARIEDRAQGRPAGTRRGSTRCA